MKRLLFISMIGLFAVSCQPAEVTCDCTGTGTGGGSVTVTGGLSLIDTNLIGHWKNTNTLVNLGAFTGASDHSPATDIDVYFSPDGLVHFSHTYVRQNGGNNIFLDNQYEYKVIDDGILCINDYIIHYEINNGVFTYYHEQNLDLAFYSYRYYTGSDGINFDNDEPYLLDYYYYVSSNSLTKQ